MILPIVNCSYNRNISSKYNLRYKYGREEKGDVFIKSSSIDKPVQTFSKQDKEYRKQLCKLSGIKGITPEKITSVIGPDELKKIISDNSENRVFYLTGERPLDKKGIPDSNDIEFAKSKLFGANIHIHTTHSDGELSVEEVLNQAADYADEYVKTSHKPFLVGITDHNTISGCKEAVKIIASDPDKYKNIKVVLGSEISAKEDDINGYKLRKPEKYHILALCVNPYEKTINNFFNSLITESNNVLRPKTITIKEAVDGVKHQQQCHISLAHPAYPDITHRIYSDKDPYETIVETMTHFKDIAGDKALYAEAYYGGYSGNLATDEKLYDTIYNTCDKLKLLKAGGLDTHGGSIFYNGQNLN